MNVLKALYCNQHFELKPKGKANIARTYGTRLLTISLALNVITVVIVAMLLSEDLKDAFGDLIKDIFGRRAGRSIGKVVAIIPFLFTYPIVRYTLGTEASYQELMTSFEQKSAQEQAQISKKGLHYFVASMIGFGVAIVLVLVFLA